MTLNLWLRACIALASIIDQVDSYIMVEKCGLGIEIGLVAGHVQKKGFLAVLTFGLAEAALLWLYLPDSFLMFVAGMFFMIIVSHALLHVYTNRNVQRPNK